MCFTFVYPFLSLLLSSPTSREKRFNKQNMFQCDVWNVKTSPDSDHKGHILCLQNVLLNPLSVFMDVTSFLSHPYCPFFSSKLQIENACICFNMSMRNFPHFGPWFLHVILIWHYMIEKEAWITFDEESSIVERCFFLSTLPDRVKNECASYTLVERVMHFDQQQCKWNLSIGPSKEANSSLSDGRRYSLLTKSSEKSWFHLRWQVQFSLWASKFV